jgi:hypothetical protein
MNSITSNTTPTAWLLLVAPAVTPAHAVFKVEAAFNANSAAGHAACRGAQTQLRWAYGEEFGVLSFVGNNIPHELPLSANWLASKMQWHEGEWITLEETALIEA